MRFPFDTWHLRIWNWSVVVQEEEEKDEEKAEKEDKEEEKDEKAPIVFANTFVQQLKKIATPPKKLTLPGNSTLCKWVTCLN